RPKGRGIYPERLKITAFFCGAKATINLDKMQAIFRNLGRAIRHYAACHLDKKVMDLASS
ncbi:MAG TPA: hypothetical protein VIK28_06195, partial [Sedimentisphaerales bacterium]